ncbi:unnamed protein product [Cyprideis torosa]|uniref:Uncharacterized protein n=1 Tax=Cyprideis torosa TaxID=163714 RepID=A0A7R8ZML2_9CRUS|nr:unnamed protein product [Cyprideis torosa]CAG0895725.1 unnamed protein product [Cyprideis torosa]
MSSAVEAQERVQRDVKAAVNELDQYKMRRLQGDMHRCAAACCDDKSGDMEYTHRCIEECSRPMVAAQEYVQREMQQLQDRLQRCMMDCEDGVRDKIRPDTKDTEVEVFKQSFEKCAVSCVDKTLSTLPTLTAKWKAYLDKI